MKRLLNYTYLYYQMSIAVKLVRAELLVDTDTFSKSDPYVVLILGQQKKKGKAANNAGKTPAWNETLTFNRTKDNLLTIEVWDKDTLSADDLIGTAKFDLTKLFVSPKTNFAQRINLTAKEKPTGEIFIEFEYNGPAQQQPQGQQGPQYNQPNPQYNPNPQYAPNQPNQQGQQFNQQFNQPNQQNNQNQQAGGFIL